MRRLENERAIAANRQKLWRQLNAETNCSFTPQIGVFRKARRAGGCGKSRCQLCHPEKNPKRRLTLKEQLREFDDRERKQFGRF
jgi:hypothetical protein